MLNRTFTVRISLDRRLRLVFCLFVYGGVISVFHGNVYLSVCIMVG